MLVCLFLCFLFVLSFFPRDTFVYMCFVCVFVCVCVCVCICMPVCGGWGGMHVCVYNIIVC